jgi:DNA-binding transcriptional LysR family regulator
MQWTDRIGRRVKLCDLHVFLAVAHCGSISRAAGRLSISHPVVSRTISDLEHALGVRLFDRSSRGVEPTMYGRAFLDCGRGRIRRSSTRHPASRAPVRPDRW